MYGYYIIVIDVYVVCGILVCVFCVLMLDIVRYVNSLFLKIDDVVFFRSFKMLCNILFVNIEGILVIELSCVIWLGIYCVS